MCVAIRRGDYVETLCEPMHLSADTFVLAVVGFGLHQFLCENTCYKSFTTTI